MFALEAAKVEKERNKSFDKNADVDRIIKNDIPEAYIGGSIVTIGGTDFYIDRDKLEIVREEEVGDKIVIALEKAKREKSNNKNFNKNTDVDKIIRKDIPGAEITGDIVITGEGKYIIDREKLEKRDIREIDYRGNSLGSLEEIPRGTYKVSYLEDEEKAYVYEENEVPDLSGKGHTLYLKDGATVQKDGQEEYYIGFNGTGAYGQIEELEETIDWAGGFTIEFEACWDAFNAHSRILDFGCSESLCNNCIIVANHWETGEIKLQKRAGTGGWSDFRSGVIATLNTKDKFSIECTLNENGTYTGEYKKNGTSVRSGTMWKIENLKRTVNYLGKSHSGDPYFKGKIYSLKITEANGEKILEYNLTKISTNTMTVQTNGNRYEEKDNIPIYTAEQLQKIGTGKKVNISGTIYEFKENKTYVLQNDITYTGSYTQVENLIKANKIKINGQGHSIVVTNTSGVQEYYMENSKYYIAVNKYGYIPNGLQVYYDGIDNAGTGTHSSNSTIWKDLSGNNRNGTLTNMDTASCWKANGLTFDGTNDYVKIGQLNYPNITLEAVVETQEATRGEQIVIGNFEGGGNALIINREINTVNFYITGRGYCGPEPFQAVSNKKYSMSGAYDGSTIRYRSNGEKKVVSGMTGGIGYPVNNTWLMLGTNPSGSNRCR